MAANHLLATPAFAGPLGSSSDDEDTGDEDTGVFSFGQNTYGELALGDTNDRSNPTRVDLGRSSSANLIVDVACGNEQTAILFENGDVFTCGYNDSGQCAIGTTERVPSLRFSPGLSSNRTVAAGFYHSVCLVGTPKGGHTPTNGSGTLGGDLRKMLNNSTRSDVAFVLEGRPLFAHSCILVARCEPLEKMLDGRMKEGSQPEIVIPEYSYDVFATLMEFLYTDQVAALASPDLTADFALELHALADQYLVTSLRSACENALLQILSVENVVIIVESAHFRNAFTLKKRCLGFIMDHFARVIATQAFVGLPQELLQEVLLLASHQGVSIPNQANTGGAASEYLRGR
ncbi:hypothetical protein JG687_00000386 [Phytophthora cactorum]|uniref:BTB domain-containing protein n=1 Tax=Phytophthora cactorum TaxID=29920 RepID=A0A8T1V3R9_9STRA|nr:hypothetical protein JG687_00000386 [Phytophthora cactorum]